MTEAYRALDRAAWSSVHWSVFISTSLGFFVWGFVYSISTLVTSWPIVPEGFASVILLISPVSLVIGNFTLGSLADRVGRKRAFLVTVTLYAVGLIGIILSSNFYMLLLSLVIAQLGVGGEEPPALAALAEFTPARQRGRAIILASNFFNVGAVAAALIGFYGLSSVELEKLFFGIASVILLAAIVTTRRKMPESVRWLLKKNRVKEAEEILGDIRREGMGRNGSKEGGRLRVQLGRYSLPFAFAVLAALGVSQLTTYGLLAFIVGPYEFPSLTPQIILVANAGASISGLLASGLVERISRRLFAFLSFSGGLATVLLVLLAAGSLNDILFFYLMLFLNMIFSEFAWATRVVLEPELFRTAARSTFISLVRVVSWGFYIGSIYATASLATYQFIALNVVLWAVGAFAALSWFLKGIETGGICLEAITGESGLA
jgi:putative MFS transporter